MYFTVREKEYFVDPLLSLSSLNPDTNNDWADWRDENQQVLAYNDIVWVALDDKKYFEKEYTIYFASTSIKLDNTMSEVEFTELKNTAKEVWKGDIDLPEEMLLVGETSSGGYRIPVGTKSVMLQIFTKFNAKLPYFLIIIESH